MSRLAAALAAALALSAPAAALQKETGGSAAEFLRLGAGARALGMGEAYTAVAERPEGAYWNPAGIALAETFEASYSRSELPAGVHHDYAAVALPWRLARGGVGFSFTRLSEEPLDRMDANNQKNGSFAPHAEAYALTYGIHFNEAVDHRGRPLHRRTSVREQQDWDWTCAAGLSIKAIQQDLGTRRASAFAADGGVLARPPGLRGLRLAGAFRNVGTKLRFIRDEQPLPGELAAAAAYPFQGREWRFIPALEAAVPYAGDPYGKLGIEASRAVSERAGVALRLGYTSRPVASLGPIAGVTAGMGLRVSGFSFDVAFQPMAVMGQSFRLSVGWRF